MSEATGVDAATIVCRTLSQLGARHVFGVPGTQSTAFYEALRRSALRAIVPTHELAAAFMAGAYHRAGGGPGILTTIPGPGLAYALAGLAEARLDSAAVLYFVNAREGRARPGYGPQAIDQRALLAPVTKAVIGVRDLRRRGRSGAARLGARAVGRAGPGRDRIRRRHAMTLRSSMPLTAPRRRRRIAAAWQRIARCEEAAAARRPGRTRRGCRVRALAERLRAPILTTPSARGIVAGGLAPRDGLRRVEGHARRRQRPDRQQPTSCS